MTTTIGIKYKDGIILAADRQVSSENFVASKTGDKIYQVDKTIGVTISGLVADAYNLVERLKAEFKLYYYDKKRSIPIENAARLASNIFYGTFRGGPIVGRGMFMPEFASALSDPETSQGGKPNVHYTVGASAIKIEVDTQTGKITIPKVILAVDVGKAINPDLVKGQVIGGLVQGIATVLYEDMRFDDNGRLLNPNFTDYKIPTSLDIPKEVIAILIEVAQPDGPFGARGVGEHTMIPAAPIIANAVEDALGIRIKSLPITAEKIAMELVG